MTKTEEKEISSAFDCLAVTQVQVFPFKEGPSMRAKMASSWVIRWIPSTRGTTSAVYVSR